MKPEESVFQILRETGMGEKLVSWYEKEEDAQTELKELQTMFPKEYYRIEEGTDYIYTKCKGCGTVHATERHDHYGITTGHWCDDCYESDKYPYRKDRYPTMEHDGYGDYLEPEDY